MTNAEALNHVATVMDRRADFQSSSLTDGAIQLLADKHAAQLSNAKEIERAGFFSQAAS
jgi:hypothetical protein